MTEIANIDEQLAHARALLKAVAEGAPHGGGKGEAAMSHALDAIKRVFFVGMPDGPQQAQAEYLVHVIGYLGEVIGHSLTPLPAKLQVAAMRLFADQLSAAQGATVARIFTTPAKSQESLH